MNEKWVKTKKSRKPKDFLELNENGYTAYRNLWGSVTVFKRDKFIVLNQYIKKSQRASLAGHPPTDLFPIPPLTIDQIM